MRHVSTVTRKGQITIPIEFRRRLGIREGDQVEFVERGAGLEVACITSVQNISGGSLFESLPEDDPIRLAAGSLAKYSKPHLSEEERFEGEKRAIERGWTERELRFQKHRKRKRE